MKIILLTIAIARASFLAVVAQTVQFKLHTKQSIILRGSFKSLTLSMTNKSVAYLTLARPLIMIKVFSYLSKEEHLIFLQAS